MALKKVLYTLGTVKRIGISKSAKALKSHNTCMASLLLLVCCNATMTQFMEDVKQAAKNPLLSNKNKSGTANGGQSDEDAGSLKKVGIYDIFVNAPFNEGDKSNHQWPRVAIEVISSPPNVNQFYAR